MAVRFGDGRDWFFERRFGLFVHWGLYAIQAWHEQTQYRRGVPRREYERLIHEFNPARFDPDAWLDLADATGMQYVCFTTKHIDGFCMWDTGLTDYNVMNTPYGRDILGMLAEACRRRGIPLCLYYSAVDNHHPNYPNQGRPHELPGPEEDDAPDLEKYMDYLKGQVRELCTRYGEIHGFWWDANRTGIRDPSINAAIRSLQPKAILNDRGFDDGDFGTPERDPDGSIDQVSAFERPTEACQSVGAESWGYREGEDYFSDAYLMRSIDKIMARGGNYLLNVGPKADGTIPAEATPTLRRIGEWYATVREAFDGAEPASHLTDNREVLLTRKGNVLYVHLLRGPVRTGFTLKPIDVLPRKVTLLNTGAEVAVRIDRVPSLFRDPKAYLCLRDLPVNDLAGTAPVVKLEFDPSVLGPRFDKDPLQ